MGLFLKITGAGAIIIFLILFSALLIARERPAETETIEIETVEPTESPIIIEAPMAPTASIKEKPVVEKKLEVEEQVSEPAPEPVLATTTPDIERQIEGVFASQLTAKEIDLRAIVAIQCIFENQFTPQNMEQYYFQGSGIVISSQGHILTANHILIYSEPEDLAGRKWFLKKCQAATTDPDNNKISYKSDRFKDVDIIFQPSSEEYAKANGYDFAILKFSEEGEFAFEAPISDRLVYSGNSYETITLGYPGKTPLTVDRVFERFDALSDFRWILFDCADCSEGLQENIVRYRAIRDTSKFDLWKETNQGVISAYFRQGFSGSPVFTFGNLVGIVTHGFNEGTKDTAYILSTHTILKTLEESGDLLYD